MDDLCKRLALLVLILTLCHICIALYKPGKTEVPKIPRLKQQTVPSFYDTEDKREVAC